MTPLLSDDSKAAMLTFALAAIAGVREEEPPKSFRHRKMSEVEDAIVAGADHYRASEWPADKMAVVRKIFDATRKKLIKAFPSEEGV